MLTNFNNSCVLKLLSAHFWQAKYIKIYVNKVYPSIQYLYCIHNITVMHVHLSMQQNQEQFSEIESLIMLLLCSMLGLFQTQPRSQAKQEKKPWVRGCFKRRDWHGPNALKTMHNETVLLVIYCF